MDQPVQLIPLICIRCSRPIPAETDQVAWVCGNCGQGMFLHENYGLADMEVSYSSTIPPGGVGKPFWVADGQVSLIRQSFGKSRGADQDAETFWNRSHRFYVPAYSAPLEARLDLAMRLLTNPPALQPGPAAPFQSVILSLEDLRPAAEFIIVAIEAGRSDKLKQVNFELQLSPAVLWILP